MGAGPGSLGPVNLNLRVIADYGVQNAADMAVDARQFEPAELAIEVLRKLDAFDRGLLERVAAAQERTASAVGKAIDELTDWIQSLQR